MKNEAGVIWNSLYQFIECSFPIREKSLTWKKELSVKDNSTL